MITCKNCGAQLPDGSKFCQSCGQSIAVEAPAAAEPVAAPVAEPVAAPVAEPVAAPVAAAAAAAPQQAKPNFLVTAKNKVVEIYGKLAEKAPFLRNKKIMFPAAGALALVLVVVIIISIFAGGKKFPSYILYIKDDELNYSSTSKIDPFEVTDNLLDDYSIGASSLASRMSTYARISKDGKNLFYIDRLDNSDSGYNLYFRSVSNRNKEAVKLDSDVTSYCLTDGGKGVLYIKDSKLYKHNLKEKEKLASDVVGFIASENGKQIVYQDDESRLYFKSGNKDKEKIDSDISRICSISKDCKTVYYIKNEKLYKKVMGKDKEKLAGDVASVVCAYDNGTFYFLKQNEEEIQLMDYVNDDMAAADKAMKEPVAPERPTVEYPYSFEYDTYEEYEAAYEAYEKAWDDYYAAYDAYEEAEDEYYEKEERDELREELEDYTTEMTVYTLYYYDGKKEVKLSENVDRYSFGTYSIKNAVVVYGVKDKAKIDKVKLSEIYSIYDVTSAVEDAMDEGEVKRYVATKDKSTALEHDSCMSIRMTEDGKTIYYTYNKKDKANDAKLYKVAVNGTKLGKAELIDEDVYGSYIVLTADNKIAYFKDVEDGEGELYINKTLIADDVNTGLTVNEAKKTLLFYTDYDNEDNAGTLNVTSGNKPTKIADDVYTYQVTPAGDVLYLVDYSTSRKEGELYLYKNKPVKVDDDVQAIVPIYDWTETVRYY